MHPPMLCADSCFLIRRVFQPSADEKAFCRMFCTDHGIAPFFFFFNQLRVKVQSDQFYYYWWNCHSAIQQTHHWIAVLCLPSSFGSWMASLFLAKCQILIKVCLTWIHAFEIIRAGLAFIVRFGIHSHKGKHPILINLWQSRRKA